MTTSRDGLAGSDEAVDRLCRGEAYWRGLHPPYAALMVDPPWADIRNGNVAPTRVGRVLADRSIRAQYATLTPGEVAALPVADLAAANSHLYLWTTNLNLPDALEVMQAWGFRYNTLITWVKLGHLGMGYHWRGMTEHMLFGVRGSLRTLDRGLVNHFTARKAGHSVKPDEAYDLVERASPGPRVELFARRHRPGWDVWGDQLGRHADQPGLFPATTAVPR